MALKLSRDDLEMHRRHGASIRSPAKEEPPKPAPAEAPIDTHRLGMDKLAQVVSDVVKQAVSQSRPQLVSRQAPTYRFDIKRDDKGYIQEIIARPTND